MEPESFGLEEVGEGRGEAEGGTLPLGIKTSIVGKHMYQTVRIHTSILKHQTSIKEHLGQ